MYVKQPQQNNIISDLYMLAEYFQNSQYYEVGESDLISKHVTRRWLNAVDLASLSLFHIHALHTLGNGQIFKILTFKDWVALLDVVAVRNGFDAQ